MAVYLAPTVHIIYLSAAQELRRLQYQEGSYRTACARVTDTVPYRTISESSNNGAPRAGKLFISVRKGGKAYEYDEAGRLYGRFLVIPHVRVLVPSIRYPRQFLDTVL